LEEKAIIVKNISKKFYLKKQGIKNFSKILGLKSSNGRFTALDDISFEISKGEIFGIIGKNGSGKTTLLRIISGIYPPDSGSIKVNGRLSPMLQIGTGFRNELNSEENIMITGLLYGFKKSQIKNKIEKIIKFAELEKFQKAKLSKYSSGMRSRLAFSTALELNPDILIVDEILAVGDAQFHEKSLNAFLSLVKSNKTILISSHNLNMLQKLCNRIMLIDNGKVVTIGTPENSIKTYNEIIKSSKSKNE